MWHAWNNNTFPLNRCSFFIVTSSLLFSWKSQLFNGSLDVVIFPPFAVTRIYFFSVLGLIDKWRINWFRTFPLRNVLLGVTIFFCFTEIRFIFIYSVRIVNHCLAITKNEIELSQSIEQIDFSVKWPRLIQLKNVAPMLPKWKLFFCFCWVNLLQ